MNVFHPYIDNSTQSEEQTERRPRHTTRQDKTVFLLLDRMDDPPK